LVRLTRRLAHAGAEYHLAVVAGLGLTVRSLLLRGTLLTLLLALSGPLSGVPVAAGEVGCNLLRAGDQSAKSLVVQLLQGVLGVVRVDHDPRSVEARAALQRHGNLALGLVDDSHVGVLLLVGVLGPHVVVLVHGRLLLGVVNLHVVGEGVEGHFLISSLSFSLAISEPGKRPTRIPRQHRQRSEWPRKPRTAP